MSRPVAHPSVASKLLADAADTRDRGDTSAQLSVSLLALMAGLAALGSLSTNIILPAFPAISKDLSVPTRDLGVVLSSFFVAFALGQLIVGPLSDRYGRRPLVLGGLVLFLLGSVLCAFAPDLTWLLFGRVVQALGACAASVLARAIARDQFEGPSLSRTLALITVAMAAAPGFSPLLGGALNELIGWRGEFVTVGALGLLLGIHYIFTIGETLPTARRSAASATAVLEGYVELLATARFMAPASSVSLILGGLYAFFGTAPALLIDGLGLSAFELGLFFASTVLVVFVAGLLVPFLTRRAGQRRLLRIGIVISIAGSLLLVVAPHTLTAFTLGLSLFLLGMGMVNPLGTAMALQPFGRQAGAASALLGFLQMGSAAIAISICSLVSADAYLALGLILSGCTTLSLLASLLASRAPSDAVARLSR